MSKEPQEAIGKIHKKETLFLRTGVGSAKRKEGCLGYDLSTEAKASIPIVQSLKTRKWFTLSWTDIVNLAINAGIDKKGD